MKSGKSYVGLTKASMERRWVQHKSESRKAVVKYHFHKAIKLYGVNNWTHKVLACGIDTIEEAITLEIYFIKLYDTFENGYNSTIGGEGAHVNTDDPSVYEVYHEEHGAMLLTCRELSNEFNLRMDRVIELVKGDITILKGWVLAGNREPVRKFINLKSLEKFVGTTAQFVHYYQFKKDGVNRMINGKRATYRKWVLEETK